MLRLRMTVALSVLALAVGLGGTQWLSGLSDVGLAGERRPVQPPPAAAAMHAPPTRHHHRRRPASSTSAGAQRRLVHRQQAVFAAAAAAPVAALRPALVAVAMPMEREMTYEQLRGHLDGRVVVHVSVDGGGHVTSARLVQSSGDDVLDEHALRSVRGWRFVVPPGYPSGLDADLPMPFSSRDGSPASEP